MSSGDALCSDEELRDSVIEYKAMQREIALGKRVVKSLTYRKLAQKWGRTEKSYEMRMSNISAVLESHGRSWIAGLKPLSNVGTNVIAVIEKFLNEIDGVRDLSDTAFEIEVSKKVKKRDLDAPLGSTHPNSKLVTVTLISRDPDVKAWLLINAKGVCENCNSDAPFIASTGIPYLEVHHVKRLADSGPDTIWNAVAVCPNCHKALHYAETRESIVESLYKRIDRLVR